MPSWAMSEGARPTRLCPPNEIAPERTGTSPMIALQSVVLPMPLRPTTDSTPWPRVIDTPCKACEWP